MITRRLAAALWNLCETAFRRSRSLSPIWLSFIVRLLQWSSPSTISRLVIPVVVDPVDRSARWPRSHIFQKSHEVVPPSVANRNSTATVVFPILPLGIGASVDHQHQSFVLNGPREAMLGLRGLNNFFVKATARLGSATSKCINPYLSGVSTVTDAVPFSVIGVSSADGHPSAKAEARKISVLGHLIASFLFVVFTLTGPAAAGTTILSPVVKLQFFDNNGKPLVGGKLFTYIAGSVTKVATYTDYNGGTSNANPVILNSRGEANVWLTPTQAYKFVLAPSTDSDPPTNPIWTVDNINVSASGSVAYGTGAIVTTSSSIQSAIVTICVNALAPNTQTLPISPITWEQHIIKDCGGNAAANQITISGNGNLVDGNSSYILGFNRQSVNVQWNGTSWEIE